MAGIKELKEFIDFAEKNRKYATGTARGRRAALRVFEEVFTDDEKNSVDLIAERFSKIYNEVFQKNKKDITAPSLETYRRRVSGLLSDFRKYGSDPTTFSAWDTTRKREPKTSDNTTVVPLSHPNQDTLLEAEIVTSQPRVLVEGEGDESVFQSIAGMAFSAEVNKIELHLRPGFKVTLVLPSDLTANEATRLTRMIDGMVAQDDDNRL